MVVNSAKSGQTSATRRFLVPDTLAKALHSYSLHKIYFKVVNLLLRVLGQKGVAWEPVLAPQKPHKAYQQR